jgi:hypothetical protein
MNLSINGLPAMFGMPWMLVAFFALQCVLILVLAFAVKNDAERLQWKSELFLVGPWTWFFVVVLAGGYLPCLAYWLVHYSTLRSRRGERG